MATDDPGPTPGSDPNLEADRDVPNIREAGSDDADPGRRDLRAEVGKYVSLATFPAAAEDLIAAAESNGAPAQVTAVLRGLRPGTIFDSAHDVWTALNLESGERF
jgi:hypothetical protein